MVYLYPYPRSSVKFVLFDPFVRPHSPSILEILFLPPTWTFVEPDPSRSLHPSNSHLLWLQSLIPYLLPAPIWMCIHLAKPAERLFLAYRWNWQPCPRENNDPRGSSHSGPTNFTLLHDNFSFHQPCFSRLHSYADCFLNGMCIHDHFSFVFQHQFHALPASVATFLQTPTTVLSRHARPIPTHCS